MINDVQNLKSVLAEIKAAVTKKKDVTPLSEVMDLEDATKEEAPRVEDAKWKGVKPVEKPGAKPGVKPAEKPAAKPAGKPAAKPAAKPAGKPKEGVKVAAAVEGIETVIGAVPEVAEKGAEVAVEVHEIIPIMEVYVKFLFKLWEEFAKLSHKEKMETIHKVAKQFGPGILEFLEKSHNHAKEDKHNHAKEDKHQHEKHIKDFIHKAFDMVREKLAEHKMGAHREKHAVGKGKGEGEG